jgi:hypothetical protein
MLKTIFESGSFIAAIIAIVALILSLINFIWSQRVAMINADNNIISYVLSILKLFEKVKNLSPEEKKMFGELLKDAEYFDPPTRVTLHELLGSQFPANQKLGKYFEKVLGCKL